MRQIWKFQLETTDLQSVEMPDGAKVLTVQVQHGTPCIWAECDTEAEKEKRWFRTFGTGHPMPDKPGEYIGTYQLNGGDLVFHVFDEK